jgi:uncharacterized protein YqeY
VLQTWLPSALSADELDALLDEVMTACAATSMKDMGRVMAALRERAQGRADFSTLGERVKARLSGK